MAIGNELVENLLKGCKVHWQRSCQRVADNHEVLITDYNVRELNEH